MRAACAGISEGRLVARKKESTTVYLDAEVAARLRLLSKHSKVPAAVFMRVALAAALPDWEATVAKGETIAWDEQNKARRVT